MRLQPGMQGLDDRSASFLPRLSSVFGGMATDLALDRVETGDDAACAVPEEEDRQPRLPRLGEPYEGCQITDVVGELST